MMSAIKERTGYATDPYAMQRRITELLNTVGVTSEATVQQRAQWGVLLAKRDPVLADQILHDVMPYVEAHLVINSKCLQSEVRFRYPFSRILVLIEYYPGAWYPDGALYTDILCDFESIEPDQDIADED